MSAINLNTTTNATNQTGFPNTINSSFPSASLRTEQINKTLELGQRVVNSQAEFPTATAHGLSRKEYLGTQEDQNAYLSELQKEVKDNSRQLDYKNMSIQDIMNEVMSLRAGSLDKDIRGYFDKIQGRINQKKSLGDIQAVLEKYTMAKEAKSTDSAGLSNADAEMIRSLIKNQGLEGHFSTLANNPNSDKWSPTWSELNAVRSTLNNAISNIDSTNALDQTQFSNLFQRYNQTIELISTMNKKFFDAISGILANMR